MNLLVTVLIFIENESGSTSWWNYPGWEAWKFFNLFLFVGFIAYLLRRPLSESLVARREAIKRELLRAQEDRAAAMNKLAEVEARLTRLDAEVKAIRTQAEKEAVEEQDRITRATEEELKKLREQAQREIDATGKAAQQELRRYVAEQSVRLAGDMIRRDMRVEDDSRLMSEYVEGLGGVGR